MRNVIVFGLIAAGFLGGGCAGEIEKDDLQAAVLTAIGETQEAVARQATAIPRPSTTPVPSETPTPRFERDLKRIGPIFDSDRGDVYELEISVEGVEWMDDDDGTEPRKGNVFVLVHLAAANVGPGIGNFGDWDLQVRDANGVIRDYEYLWAGEDCWLDAVDIAPGGEYVGCVGFEVPAEGEVELIYAPYQADRMGEGRFLSFTLRSE